LRKTKTDDVTPAPAWAGVNLSPRKRGAGVQSEKAGFPLEFIPHTMRGGNDKYGYIVVTVLSIMSKEV